MNFNPAVDSKQQSFPCVSASGPFPNAETPFHHSEITMAAGEHGKNRDVPSDCGMFSQHDKCLKCLSKCLCTLCTQNISKLMRKHMACVKLVALWPSTVKSSDFLFKEASNLWLDFGFIVMRNGIQCTLSENWHLRYYLVKAPGLLHQG